MLITLNHLNHLGGPTIANKRVYLKLQRSSDRLTVCLHYIEVIYSGLMYQLLNYTMYITTVQLKTVWKETKGDR